MAFDYDVIVVGGGPAGSSAGRVCAQAGLKTLLIEKERFPRYKVCGGCLSVKASRFLDFDLRPVIENTITGARITYTPEDPLLLESSEPIGFMVMRDRFDHLLVEKAMEKGTEVLEGEKVLRVRETDSVLEVELEKGWKLRCEYLIGADGPGSVVSKAFPDLRQKDSGTGIGLESEVPLHAVDGFPAGGQKQRQSVFRANPQWVWVGLSQERRAFHRGRWNIRVKKKVEPPGSISMPS